MKYKRNLSFWKLFISVMLILASPVLVKAQQKTADDKVKLQKQLVQIKQDVQHLDQENTRLASELKKLEALSARLLEKIGPLEETAKDK